MMTARDVHSGLTARHATVIVHDVTVIVHAQPATVQLVIRIVHAAMVTALSAVSVHRDAMATAQRVIQTDHVVMATAHSVAFRATDHAVTLIAQTATPLRENTANLAPIRHLW